MMQKIIGTLFLYSPAVCLLNGFCIPGQHTGQGFLQGFSCFLTLRQYLFIDQQINFFLKQINCNPVVICYQG